MKPTKEITLEVDVLHSMSTFQFSCLAAGKFNISIRWLFNGAIIRNSDPCFVISQDDKKGNFLYELKTGQQSLLGWNVVDESWNCNSLTEFDGNYQCQAYQDGNESKTSAVMKQTSLSKFKIKSSWK